MPAPAMQNRPLIFLKLGGSLITDKQRPRTPRPEVLSRLAGEIGRALKAQPKISLVLGNGAGSFGHVTAKKYGTRQGVRTEQEWKGFAEIWREAAGPQLHGHRRTARRRSAGHCPAPIRCRNG